MGKHSFKSLTEQKFCHIGKYSEENLSHINSDIKNIFHNFCLKLTKITKYMWILQYNLFKGLNLLSAEKAFISE